MKSLYILALLALAPFTSTFAAEIDCAGRVKIPAKFTSDLRYPSCIALDLKMKIAVIAGAMDVKDGMPQMVSRAFALKKGGVQFLNQMTLNQIKPKTISAYAFEMNCGISLISARVVNQNEVVLVFDNFTALLWEVNAGSKGRLTTILSDFDPKHFYFCYGIEAGIFTYEERIQVNSRRRIVSLRDLYFGKEVGKVKAARF